MSHWVMQNTKTGLFVVDKEDGRGALAEYPIDEVDVWNQDTKNDYEPGGGEKWVRVRVCLDGSPELEKSRVDQAMIRVAEADSQLEAAFGLWQAADARKKNPSVFIHTVSGLPSTEEVELLDFMVQRCRNTLREAMQQLKDARAKELPSSLETISK